MQHAVRHFAKTEGIDLPESTVRGLRDKFLVSDSGPGRKRKTEVARRGRTKEEEESGEEEDEEEEEEEEKLDYGPRGRPLTLGKYDQLVTK